MKQKTFSLQQASSNMSVEPPAQSGYVQESNLKLLQLEHDLKLKEMKLQLNELSSKTQIEELR